MPLPGLGNLVDGADQATPLLFSCWASTDHRCTGARESGPGPRRRALPITPHPTGRMWYSGAAGSFTFALTRVVPKSCLNAA